ncbi:ankyrin repeat domain-containing protein [Candidatus Babela massiliensis]|nr:ankyrin repeat domain-containing protein [Candidatus Babela massiliensis]
MKNLYPIILLIMLINHNLTSMQNLQATSPVLNLPNETISHIIRQLIELKLNDTINEWNNIFAEPNSIKIDVKELEILSKNFPHWNDLITESLNSISLKNSLKDLMKVLKQERFLKLFNLLEKQSKKEYENWLTDKLNKTLTESLMPVNQMYKQDFTKVVKLVLAGANVNLIYYSLPLICHAAKHNRKEIVKILIQAGADVNYKDNNGMTTLMHIARSNNQIAQILINAHANIDAKDNRGYTALSWAAGFNAEETVKLLIQAGANVNSESESGLTTLIRASKYGYKKIVEILIKADANVNVKMECGCTALSSAFTNYHKELVEMLIDKGADISTQNNTCSGTCNNRN